MHDLAGDSALVETPAGYICQVRQRDQLLNLIDRIGFAPVDTGSLADGGGLQQPGSSIYNKPMTGAQARALLGR